MADVGRTVHVLEDVGSIRPVWLAGAQSVGLVSYRSAPRGLERAVVEALSGLGPLSLAHREVRTRVSNLELWLSDHRDFATMPTSMRARSATPS